MKSALIAALVVGGAPTLVAAQDAPPAAVVAHREVHTQTVTHNDGRPHRQVTRYRHRTIVKTPRGTMVRTTTSTTTTPPK